MQLYTYNIPLHPSPLPLSERFGLILESTSGGLGEAAPLPGFGGTLKEALEFGFRCARVPFPPAWPRIPLSALVSNLEEAKLALSRGFRTLKVKVKQHSPESALDLVRALQSPKVCLRIDVNRRWTLPEALWFFTALDPAGIEYIEEPLDEPKHLAELPPHPIALDETLLEKEADALVLLPNVRALVLKPTLLGNRLDHWLEPRGKRLVFSSSFESAIGLLHIAHLQARFAPDSAVGLDTHRSFTANFLPFPTENGMLSDQPNPPIDRSLWHPFHVR